ncbi:hypothetical protein JXL19_08895 [bacterium]|nr:hypothetical protein [bacterium]
MKTFWILILIKRGFIQTPEIFYSKKAAYNRKKALLKDLNPDYDELGVFEKHFNT